MPHSRGIFLILCYVVKIFFLLIQFLDLCKGDSLNSEGSIEEVNHNNWTQLFHITKYESAMSFPEGFSNPQQRSVSVNFVYGIAVPFLLCVRVLCCINIQTLLRGSLLNKIDRKKWKIVFSIRSKYIWSLNCFNNLAISNLWKNVGYSFFLWIFNMDRGVIWLDSFVKSPIEMYISISSWAMWLVLCDYVFLNKRESGWYSRRENG